MVERLYLESTLGLVGLADETLAELIEDKGQDFAGAMAAILGLAWFLSAGLCLCIDEWRKGNVGWITTETLIELLNRVVTTATYLLIISFDPDA